MSRITHDICDMLHVPHHPVAKDGFDPGKSLLTSTPTSSEKRMVIAGGNGYLGKLLTNHFTTLGWNVAILTRHRKPSSHPEVRFVEWDGINTGAWTESLEGADVLINLAGRSVNCRYHARNRREMMESRLQPTRALGRAVQRCKRPPRVWLNASTATIYKHTLGPAWDERGEIGATPEAKDEFSIEIATAWERAFDEFATPETRKVKLRSAMVLGCDNDSNNAFVPLARLARLGLGGQMGSGEQFVSWIHETDFCRAIKFIIENETMQEVVNVTAPTPLPNREMMRTLRAAVGTPFGLPASEWMLELGAFLLRTETELIIKSRRVIPAMLLDMGFRFGHPTFAEAVANLLSLTKPTKPITTGGHHERIGDLHRAGDEAHAT